jgi:hypothetical protein
MRGFPEAASGMRQTPFRFPHSRMSPPALLLGITAWPRCQSMRQSGKEEAAGKLS